MADLPQPPPASPPQPPSLPPPDSPPTSPPHPPCLPGWRLLPSTPCLGPAPPSHPPVAENAFATTIALAIAGMVSFICAMAVARVRSRVGHQGYWATKAAPVQEWLVGLGPQGLCGPRSRRAGVYPPPLTSCCAPFVRSQVISTCVTGCKYRTEHRQRKALMRRKSMRDVSAFSGFTGEGTQGAGAGAGAFAGSLTLGDAQGRSLSNFTKAAAAPGAAPAVSEIVQAV